ncbi:hypothetical protein [Campylobacter sp. JMF_08 NE1]|uniref:hypothetical protein n=1 Tax=Campylobacter sp. JMF_08 NE1 TaxID=2983821 RepID=UPI0022EA0FE2|nr:hypothetical protein [Campylobacter sp. JMF_08 NE1]MDA3048633.1 hypothetical protein [Campylobacter sp. JMF_08 NE1]
MRGDAVAVAIHEHKLPIALIPIAPRECRKQTNPRQTAKFHTRKPRKNGLFL